MANYCDIGYAARGAFHEHSLMLEKANLKSGTCTGRMLYLEAIRQKVNLGEVKGISQTSKGGVLEKSLLSAGGKKFY